MEEKHELQWSEKSMELSIANILDGIFWNAYSSHIIQPSKNWEESSQDCKRVEHILYIEHIIWE